MTSPHDPERGTASRNSAADRHATSGPRVVAVAFWTAVVLPVVYVPLLALGPMSFDRALLVAALVVLNAVVLGVGYPYGRDRARARRA